MRVLLDPMQPPILTASSALTRIFIPTDQMWTNVPIPELAQSTHLAATVWGATLVSASPDLNPAGERRVSRARDRCVEVGAGVCGGIRSYLFSQTAFVGEAFE